MSIYNVENIPPDRESAIHLLIHQDVDRWGELDRVWSQHRHKDKTYGLALTTLYSRAECADLPCAVALRDAAREARTQSDDDFLRKDFHA